MYTKVNTNGMLDIRISLPKNSSFQNVSSVYRVTITLNRSLEHRKDDQEDLILKIISDKQETFLVALLFVVRTMNGKCVSTNWTIFSLEANFSLYGFPM